MDSSHLLLLALSLGERTVAVPITHRGVAAPSGCKLTESCDHTYSVRGAPTPTKSLSHRRDQNVGVWMDAWKRKEEEMHR